MVNILKYLPFTLFFFIYFLIAIPFYSGDVKNHLVWAESLLREGFYGFYDRIFHDFAFPNYPPLAMLLFAVSLKLYYFSLQAVNFVNQNLPLFPSNLVYFFEWENTKIAFLKFPAILSALGLYYIIDKVLSIYKGSIKLGNSFYLLTFMANPAIIYLSAVWGQIDLLPVFFLILCLYFLESKKVYHSAVAIACGLLSKQTIIIFLPIFLYIVFKKFGLMQVVQIILIILVIFYLSYLPFNGFSTIWPLELYRKNFDLVAYSVNENAINLWGLLFDFKRVSDLETFIQIKYQHWGYIMFGAFILVPTIIFLRSKIKMENIFAFLLLISMAYFMFLTRMHERYLIPTVVFGSILAFMDKKYRIILIIMSIIGFLNLYRGLLQPDLYIINNLVNNLVLLKTAVIIYLLILLYLYYIFVKRS